MKGNNYHEEGLKSVKEHLGICWGVTFNGVVHHFHSGLRSVRHILHEDLAVEAWCSAFEHRCCYSVVSLWSQKTQKWASSNINSHQMTAVLDWFDMQSSWSWNHLEPFLWIRGRGHRPLASNNKCSARPEEARKKMCQRRLWRRPNTRTNQGKYIGNIEMEETRILSDNSQFRFNSKALSKSNIKCQTCVKGHLNYFSLFSVYQKSGPCSKLQDPVRQLVCFFYIITRSHDIKMPEYARPKTKALWKQTQKVELPWSGPPNKEIQRVGHVMQITAQHAQHARRLKPPRLSCASPGKLNCRPLGSLGTTIFVSWAPRCTKMHQDAPRTSTTSRNHSCSRLTLYCYTVILSILILYYLLHVFKSYFTIHEVTLCSLFLVTCFECLSTLFSPL